MKFRGICSLVVCVAMGCVESLPDAPPEMNLAQEQSLVENNVQLEIDHINADTKLTASQKENRIKQVRQGAEGYLKAFAESKKVRDEQYGSTP